MKVGSLFSGVGGFDLAYSLNNPGDGGRTQEGRIAVNQTVRRLTPTECERLMGLSDG